MSSKISAIFLLLAAKLFFMHTPFPALALGLLYSAFERFLTLAFAMLSFAACVGLPAALCCLCKPQELCHCPDNPGTLCNGYVLNALLSRANLLTCSRDTHTSFSSTLSTLRPWIWEQYFAWIDRRHGDTVTQLQAHVALYQMNEQRLSTALSTVQHEREAAVADLADRTRERDQHANDKGTLQAALNEAKDEILVLRQTISQQSEKLISLEEVGDHNRDVATLNALAMVHAPDLPLCLRLYHKQVVELEGKITNLRAEGEEKDQQIDGLESQSSLAETETATLKARVTTLESETFKALEREAANKQQTEALERENVLLHKGLTPMMEKYIAANKRLAAANKELKAESYLRLGCGLSILLLTGGFVNWLVLVRPAWKCY